MNSPTENSSSPSVEEATFGGGCFWCTEAFFQQVEGVEKVISGYAGGTVPNPTYEEVCTGKTGHAEVIRIHFSPEIISYRELLEIFFATHDPTTLNRQGADIGTQYRSVIFYHNAEQEESALHVRSSLNIYNVFGAPIVTEISPLSMYFPAEDYHQNYYPGHTDQPYCNAVITPKLAEFRQAMAHRLKKSSS